MYTRNGKCVEMDRNFPLAAQIEEIPGYSSNGDIKLLIAKEIDYNLNWSGVRTVISEAVFYDYWRSLVLLDVFTAEEFVNECPDMDPIVEDSFLSEWLLNKCAPESIKRRLIIKLALNITFKDLGDSNHQW